MPLLDGEFTSLDNWTFWNIRGQPQINIEDTANGASPLAVHSGNTSLRFVADHRTWHAGVYQRVNVGAFNRVRASVWGRIFDTNGLPWPGPSDPNGQRYLRIGIDPTGGNSPTSTVVQWEEIGQLYDTFRSVTIEALALTDWITLFLGIENGRNNEWPLATMIGFLDSVTLEIIGGQTPPPPVDSGVFSVVRVEESADHFDITYRFPKA